jgi:PAS domain S-box-containing protein
VGGLWGVDAGSSRLLCVEVWHAPSTAIPEFEAASRQGSFSPGVGLPGRVWKSGEPAWIPDVAGDDNFPRTAIAAHEGLHGAFASPIKFGKDVLGVMEFFSSEIRAPDADLLGMMTAIGNQVGQFIERKRAEAAVRSSEERLRFALEAARTWTWDIQLESGKVTWSENAPRVSGFALDTSPANVLTTLESVHPEDRERVVAAYGDAIREGKLFDVEYRVLRDDGTECWVAIRGRALHDERGKQARMLGVATDITKRKQIEIRLQEETETIERVNRIGQLLSAELDLQKLVQAVTDTATTLTGARFGAFFYNVSPEGGGAFTLYALAGISREEFVSLPMPHAMGAIRSDLSRRGRDPSRRRPQRPALRAAPAVPGDPVRSSARGELSRRSASVALGRGSRGSLLRASRRRRVRRARRAHRRRLGRAGGDRHGQRAFLRGRAHRAGRGGSGEPGEGRIPGDARAQLRNPIGAISNSVRVLAGGGSADEQADALFAIVGRQTSTLSRLVDDLLDVSRLTSGKIVLKREAVNLAEIAERCVASFRAAGRVNHHAITLEAGAAWVDGDATRLEQVVGNLLENAVKYTAVGGCIAVRVSAEDERVVLRVADTGRGIEAEMIPKIFDVFTQGQQSLDRAQGGLGIGLALVKRLVELHGGEVSAVSEGPGRGSEFIVRLPRGHEETRSERVAAPILPRRILVVEDHADAREALRLLLKNEGHVVEVAASGQEGVEKALALRPEVAIVDIGLPGLNGYEVAKRIRSAEGGKDIHLVALTGYGQQEDRRRAREAEFDAHLVKPLDPAELGRILARVAPAQTAPVSTAEVAAPVRRSAVSGA